MLWGGVAGELELRARGGGRGRELSGKFPYGPNHKAVLHAGGHGKRPRKEYFKQGAFKFSVDASDQEINLLVGHSFDQPLASKLGGTLHLRDTASALEFRADLPEELLQVTHVKDALTLLSLGMVTGISPGFRVAPIPDAEEVTEEDPEEGTALIREVKQAVLYELSLVVRPAYPSTQVEARSWDPMKQGMKSTARLNPQYRWRL